MARNDARESIFTEAKLLTSVSARAFILGSLDGRHLAITLWGGDKWQGIRVRRP
jgi:hypothetical protein